METPDCDNGVAVDLENGSGCGGHDDPVARNQNPGSPTSGPVPTTIVTYLLLYYFFFMFYLIDFSKTWWHAALGIVVPLAFLLQSNCLDFASPGELEQFNLGDESRQCLRLMTLALYYFFFVFYLYLVGSSVYWWHAALGIVLVTGFVMLSYLLYALLLGKYKHDDATTPGGLDGSDLSRTLLGSSARD